MYDNYNTKLFKQIIFFIFLAFNMYYWLVAIWINCLLECWISVVYLLIRNFFDGFAKVGNKGNGQVSYVALSEDRQCKIPSSMLLQM